MHLHRKYAIYIVLGSLSIFERQKICKKVKKKHRNTNNFPQAIRYAYYFFIRLVQNQRLIYHRPT